MKIIHRIKNKFKKLFSYELLLTVFFALSCSLTFTYYKASLMRFIDGIKDFLTSVAYYFCRFVDIEIDVTVTKLPSLDVLDYLPYDFDELFRRLCDMWKYVFDGYCFRLYVFNIANTLNNVLLVFMLFAPFAVCMFVIGKNALLSPNFGKYKKQKKAIKYLLSNKKIKSKKQQKYIDYIHGFFKNEKRDNWEAFKILIDKNTTYPEKRTAISILLYESPGDYELKKKVKKDIFAERKGKLFKVPILRRFVAKRQLNKKIKAYIYIICLQNIHGKKTENLQRFENKVIPLFDKIQARCKNLFASFKNRKILFYPIVIVWLLNLNILSVVIEALAYYFYFAMSQDIFNLISVQLCKLILDLVIMFTFAPFLFWLCVAYVIVHKIRKYIGFAVLDITESNFRSFLKSQPICTMFCGLMGSKKTTLMTGAAISAEIMLRDKALELLLESDMKFPNFPWIKLEDSIKKAMKSHKIYSLTSCRDFVKERKRLFEQDYNIGFLWGYDTDKYSYTYNDELDIRTVWDVIEDYTQLYFIYVIESSLLVSNYSIRVDNVLEHVGNFPLWNSELFRRNPEMVQAVSRHAHILDYDVLRLGKTMIENNPHRGSFEFGVVVFSELGKERLNQLILKELKRMGVECNQKNDLFSYWLKMIRHKSTVCNFPFVRVFGDEQRPTSLEADIRELFHVVHIRKSSDCKIIMPGFFVEEYIHDLIYPRLLNLCKQLRYSRGDSSLATFAIHNLTAALHRYYMRVYNLFGVSEVICEVEPGTQDSEPVTYTIHLSSKKVYSRRFSTDCYVLFFEDLMRLSFVGLNDYPEYGDVKATAEEFHQQHSFFVTDMEQVTVTPSGETDISQA
ncbi:MAG: hypothetical protein IJW79_04140 [Clostridia bacterium]|nr:hypothetical protein [Clostridia bacterium]